MITRFTQLSILGGLICLTCAGLILVSMGALPLPPLQRDDLAFYGITEEQAMAQTVIISASLLIVCLVLFMLHKLSRIRQRLMHMDMVLGQFIKGAPEQRVLNTRSMDEVGVLEHRINNILDVLDVFVREDRAAIDAETDGDYYHKIVRCGLMLQLKAQFKKHSPSNKKILTDGQSDALHFDLETALESLSDSQSREDDLLFKTYLEHEMGKGEDESEVDLKEYSLEKALDAGEIEIVPEDSKELVSKEKEPITAEPEVITETVLVTDAAPHIRRSAIKVKTLGGQIQQALTVFRAAMHVQQKNGGSSVSKDNSIPSQWHDIVSAQSEVLMDLASQLHECQMLTTLSKEDVESSARMADVLFQTKRNISDAADLISVISRQISMHMLSAKVEAERLGDEASDFRTVLADVKELAAETSRATTGMGIHIEKVEKASEESARIVKMLNSTMETMFDTIQSVSAGLREESEELMRLSMAPDNNNVAASSDADSETYGILGQVDEIIDTLMAAADAVVKESTRLENVQTDTSDAREVA